RAEQEEVLTLDAAYGGAYQRVTVASAVSMAVEKHKARFGSDVHMPALAERIASRAERYGQAVVVSRDVDVAGECEREMKLELEAEEEEERQTAAVVPRAEVDWDYAAALSATSVGPLRTTAKVISLASAWEQLGVEASIDSTKTSAQAVFCTHNFFNTIENNERRGSQDECLRPVDWALAFANGDVLLLSEREANGVLLARGESNDRMAPEMSTPSALIHLSYAGSAQRGPALNTNTLMRDIIQDRGAQICAALSGIWVFGGITNIPKDGREAVKSLIKGGRAAIQYIVACRDHGHMLPRSDLERLLT
ncbi:unnamed protein product, partial [Hapterophycus canaliculatus]